MNHWVVILRLLSGVEDPIDRNVDSIYKPVHHTDRVRYSVDHVLADNHVYRNIYYHRYATNLHMNRMADCTSQHRYLNIFNGNCIKNYNRYKEL